MVLQEIIDKALWPPSCCVLEEYALLWLVGKVKRLVGGRQMTNEKHREVHRHWKRLPVFLPVLAQLTDERGNEFRDVIVVLNIGQGGLLVASFRHRYRLSELAFEISATPLVEELGGREAMADVRARVLRSDRRDKYTLYGLEFLLPVAFAPDKVELQLEHILSI